MRKSALLSTVFAGALLATRALAADPVPPSDQIENITVTGVTGRDAGGGLITAEDAPKQRSTVTTDFIATQAPTANPVQLLSLLPGFNTGSSDAFGIQNSTFTVRGLDSTRVGALLEGVPLNDSGSFALYPSEWIDSENLSQISLTQGSADLDTPINSATGGIINIGMIDPRRDFGVTVGQWSGRMTRSVPMSASIPAIWAATPPSFRAPIIRPITMSDRAPTPASMSISRRCMNGATAIASLPWSFSTAAFSAIITPRPWRSGIPMDWMRRPCPAA